MECENQKDASIPETSERWKRFDYSMPCLCGNVHRQYEVWQPEKSAVTEHALAYADHHVLLEETKILSSVSGYYAWLHWQSVEIFKHGSAAISKRRENLLLNRIRHAMLPSQSGGS